MKTLKTIIFAASVVLAMVACGGSTENDEPEYVSQTYRQTIMLSAAKTDTVVILNDLKTAVSEIENSETWLMVTKQSYTSGAPSVRLTATANEDNSQRSCVVTIIAASTDKLLLTVTQEKETMLTGIDDQHDIVTDQPAHSR